MTRALLLVALVCSGCALWTPLARPGGDDLSRADALAVQGEYVSALAAYDEVVRREPEGAAAKRARAARSTLASLIAAREEIGRLERAIETRESELERARRDRATRTSETARLARDLQARDAELARARQELANRHSELGRLSAEAERLKGALEDLKRLELRLERR